MHDCRSTSGNAGALRPALDRQPAEQIRSGSDLSHPGARLVRATVMLIGGLTWLIIGAVTVGLIGPLVVNGQSIPLPPVYHPSRLQVVQPMVTREGLVATTPKHEPDGDAVFDLISASTTEQLHVEITCVYPPRFEAARRACHGYTNHVPIPHLGDRVRVTGPLVRDLVHDAQYHELEIHPAVTIEILSH